MNEKCHEKDCASSKVDEYAVQRSQSHEEKERKRKARMSRIKHKIAVISGKGGVGKSTVTVNLATARERVITFNSSNNFS